MRGEEHLCTTCLSLLPVIEPDSPNGLAELHTRFWGRIPLKLALPYLYLYKRGVVQKILHHIKYEKGEDLSINLGRQFGLKHLSLLREHIDILVPIPLHPKKKQQRGFNQSEAFASGVSQMTGIGVHTNAVKRIRYTDTQTRKGKYERWENVEGVFALHDSLPVRGMHVMIVDDVITTGATLEACLHTVLEANPASVSIAAIAMAMK
jgi:ComF family protein